MKHLLKGTLSLDKNFWYIDDHGPLTPPLLRALSLGFQELGNQAFSFQDCPFHHSRENSFSDFSIFHFLVLVCVFKLTNFISRFLARSCFYLWFQTKKFMCIERCSQIQCLKFGQIRLFPNQPDQMLIGWQSLAKSHKVCPCYPSKIATELKYI